MMTAILLAVGCFAFNVAHYAVGAKLSNAEKSLAPVRSAKWAGFSEVLQWADYVLFAGIALQDGVTSAVVICALPSIAGAMVGEYLSVKGDRTAETARRSLAHAVEASMTDPERHREEPS